ncbi:hypothetical protein NDN08_002436 [Rhodosorus marinus]|uniref:RNase III domain-containing protein n=1 Tax=Rhodosorus marinus TaxID=101924 RepID=A0AAV8UTQ4_9RHOD|nr:hypothetical protein NDN08_002436 [Rhodosorus marinus]
MGKLQSVKRVLPMRPPPPNWQLFELKRFCFEGLDIPMFRNPAVLRRALTHPTERDLSRRYGHNAAFQFLGLRLISAVMGNLALKSKPLRLQNMVEYVTSMSELAKCGNKIGLKHVVHFQRNKMGSPTDVNLLGSTYQAVAAAILVDFGYAEAQKFVERGFAELLKEKLAEEEDRFPRQPHQAISAEINFWRNQSKKLHKNKRPEPRGEIIAEEVRGRIYCRVRLEVLGIVLGRGDGRGKTQAVKNAIRGALATLQSPYETFERQEWIHGDVFKQPAHNGLLFLQALGCVKDVRKTKDDCILVDRKKKYTTGEEAIAELRQRTSHDLQDTEHMRFGLDLDTKRLSKYLEEADMKQVAELIMVANDRSQKRQVSNRLVVGHMLVDLFASEEAFWALAVNNERAEADGMDRLMRAQSQIWLQAQRAELLGFLATDKTVVEDAKNPVKRILESQMAGALRLTLSVVFENHGFSAVRDLMHAITYYE